MLNKFLDLYLEYTSGNETPETMHLWAGLSVLAGVAEKRVWIPVGFSREGLNLYVILLGPPGVVAKSTALKMAKDLLRAGKFNVMEGAVTKEKIAEEMLEMIKHVKIGDSRILVQTPVTYIANEIFTLLSSGVDMVKFLTDIWNEDNWTYKTKTAGAFTIPNVCFNLLAATTPQWFSTNVFGDLSASGFIARCIIVYETQPRASIPFFEVSSSQQEAKSRLLAFMEELRSLYGPVQMTPKAREYYAQWYLTQKIALHEDHRMASYLERKRKIFVYKVASLMALGDGRLDIHKKDVERALEVFKEIEGKMRLAYLAMGDNTMITLVMRVAAFLRGQGRIPERRLIQFLARDVDVDTYKKLREQLTTLGLARFIREGRENYVELADSSFLEGRNEL